MNKKWRVAIVKKRHFSRLGSSHGGEMMCHALRPTAGVPISISRLEAPESSARATDKHSQSVQTQKSRMRHTVEISSTLAPQQSE